MKLNIESKLETIFQSESGMTLIETIVALAILGIAGITFLIGLAVTSKATAVADEKVTADSLARSQIEWVKNATYSTGATYTPAPIPGDNDYANYSALIAAEPLHTTEDGIQKVTITIKHGEEVILTWETYKVNR